MEFSRPAESIHVSSFECVCVSVFISRYLIPLHAISPHIDERVCMSVHVLSFALSYFSVGFIIFLFFFPSLWQLDETATMILVFKKTKIENEWERHKVSFNILF